MEKDTEITEVMFRVDTDGVFALFPHTPERGTPELVTCYQHVGQHSIGNYKHCLRTSIQAKTEQYADLKTELEGLGYNLEVVERRNPKKFKKACE